jgi:hypothetical protein
VLMENFSKEGLKSLSKKAKSSRCRR